MGGGVWKRFEIDVPLLPNGLEIKRWAVAVLAVFMGILKLAIFSSALAKPSGYLVSSAPEASARYSRRREIASFIKVAIIGDRIMRTMPTIAKAPPLLLSLLPPLNIKPLKNISEIIETNPTSTTTALISKISRLPI